MTTLLNFIRPVGGVMRNQTDPRPHYWGNLIAVLMVMAFGWVFGFGMGWFLGWHL